MKSDQLRFRCHHCGKRLKASPERAGARIDCPECGGAVLVPAPEEKHLATEVSLFAGADEADEPVLPARGPAPPDEGPDMTPMVDVVFQLLIFFMVTAAFTQQKSLQIPPPDQKSTTPRTVQDFEEDNEFVVVRIDGDNTIWVDDEETLSNQDFLAKLRAAQRGEGSHQPRNMLVLASGEARHDTVVRALDAGNAVGMESVQLAMNDQDE